MLAAGDKLGPYEILEPIGKGGMGEVYKAADPRTGREVAIKLGAERFSERCAKTNFLEADFLPASKAAPFRALPTLRVTGSRLPARSRFSARPTRQGTV